MVPPPPRAPVKSAEVPEYWTVPVTSPLESMARVLAQTVELTRIAVAWKVEGSVEVT